MRSLERVLAIDPGRDKCGIAVVDRSRGVIRQAIVSTTELYSVAKNWTRELGCSQIVVGDKTASRRVREDLADLLTTNAIESTVTVDEHKSTELARGRYWQTNPPRGWRKFVPRGLLVPPCAIDDFAAIILAERYFERNAKRM